MRSDGSGGLNGDEFAMLDAAYVLGALSPAERRDLEAHLKGCAACTNSVAELAGLPGLMSRVTVEELTTGGPSPPKTLLPSLAQMARRERRRQSLVVGALAATAASLITLGAVALTMPDSPGATPIASSSAPSGVPNLALDAVAPSPVSATARMVDMAWGTRIELTCAYDAKAAPAYGDQSHYALVVVDRRGAAQQVATWRILPDGKLTITGASSLARRDIATVEVRTESGRAVLRHST
jgi:hypothetical protein